MGAELNAIRTALESENGTVKTFNIFQNGIDDGMFITCRDASEEARNGPKAVHASAVRSFGASIWNPISK